MEFSVTKNGKPLDKSLYTWDEKTRTFSTSQHGLVLDFNGTHGVTFKTGNNCIFKSDCHCTFNTGDSCKFVTGYGCTFKTGNNCTFDATWNCTFYTGHYCTFDTGPSCIFDTKTFCMFKTGYDCTFVTGDNCVVVCRDIFKTFVVPSGTKIKMDDSQLKGYSLAPETHVITIDGKDVEISEESFNHLKEQLTGE